MASIHKLDLKAIQEIPEDDSVLELILPDPGEDRRYSSKSLITVFKAIPPHVQSLRLSPSIFDHQTPEALTQILDAIPPGVALEIPKHSPDYFNDLARAVNVNKTTKTLDNIIDAERRAYIGHGAGIGAMIGTITGLSAGIALVLVFITPIGPLIGFAIVGALFVGAIVGCFIGVGIGAVMSAIGFLINPPDAVETARAALAHHQDIFSKIFGKFKYTDASPKQSHSLQKMFKERFKLNEYPGQFLMRSLTNGVANNETMEMAREIAQVDGQFAIDMVRDLIMIAGARNNPPIMSNLKKFVAILPEDHQSEIIAMALKELPLFKMDKEIESYPSAIKDILLEMLSMVNLNTMNKVLLVPEEKGGLDVGNTSRETYLNLQTRLYNKETLEPEQKNQLLRYLVDHISTQDKTAEAVAQQRRRNPVKPAEANAKPSEAKADSLNAITLFKTNAKPADSSPGKAIVTSKYSPK